MNPKVACQTRLTYLGIIEVERVIIVEVALDRIQIQQNIIELFQEKEAGRHALTARYGIALGSRSTHQLKVLLRNLKVLPLQEIGALFLTNGGIDDRLKNVLVWNARLELLYERVRRRDVVLFQMEYDEIETRLGQNIDERRKHLQGAFAPAEHNRIVTSQISRVRE